MAADRLLPIDHHAADDNSKITHLDDFTEKFVAKCTLDQMIRDQSRTDNTTRLCAIITASRKADAVPKGADMRGGAGQFAVESGKHTGEFYTPQRIDRLAEARGEHPRLRVRLRSLLLNVRRRMARSLTSTKMTTV